MKKNYSIWLWIIFLFINLVSCEKGKTESSELSKLPPATQSGANTFGCLVNGKAWVAQRNDCRIFCDPSFKILYDGNYGGYVGIEAIRLDVNNNINERFDITFDSANYKLIHPISISNPLTTANFKNFIIVNSCNTFEHYSDSNVIHIGKLFLTKYDLSNGIISGTFDFTLIKSGCETIVVTEGRFDKKL